MRKKRFCLLLTVLMVGILLCGCRSEYPRPDFDTVRITYTDYEDQSDRDRHYAGSRFQIVRETTDPVLMDELWEIYTTIEAFEHKRPPVLPIYRIAYLKDGAVIEEWEISCDWVVRGGRFSGNHTLKNSSWDKGDSTWFDRITELFENCEE